MPPFVIFPLKTDVEGHNFISPGKVSSDINFLLNCLGVACVAKRPSVISPVFFMPLFMSLFVPLFELGVGYGYGVL